MRPDEYAEQVSLLAAGLNDESQHQKTMAVAGRCREAPGRKQNNNRSFRPNVPLANDAAEVVILDTKKGGEIGIARFSVTWWRGLGSSWPKPWTPCAQDVGLT
jgi:hypothetical protein